MYVCRPVYGCCFSSWLLLVLFLYSPKRMHALASKCTLSVVCYCYKFDRSVCKHADYFTPTLNSCPSTLILGVKQCTRERWWKSHHWIGYPFVCLFHQWFWFRLLGVLLCTSSLEFQHADYTFELSTLSCACFTNSLEFRFSNHAVELSHLSCACLVRSLDFWPSYHITESRHLFCACFFANHSCIVSHLTK